MGVVLPKMMKAAVVDAAGPPSVVHVKEVPVPRLVRGHVIIAIDYASVGSWDAQLRAGEWGPVRRGTILGADGTGTIAAAASDVKALRVGDRVYSYSYGNSQGGFHAEYVSVRADRVAHAPRRLSPPVAGAIPCVALTAQSGLKTLKLKRGQPLLVYGASGGVGSLAVWLASRRGVGVTGTARPDAHDYVRALGAEHVIDPRSREREAAIKRAAPHGFDGVLATASGHALAGFIAHLRPHAPLVYPGGVEPEPQAPEHAVSTFDAGMSHEAFAQLNRAIGTQTIPVRVEIFALKDAVKAHRRIDAGHVVGKVVLRIR